MHSVLLRHHLRTIATRESGRRRVGGGGWRVEGGEWRVQPARAPAPELVPRTVPDFARYDWTKRCHCSLRSCPDVRRGGSPAPHASKIHRLASAATPEAPPVTLSSPVASGASRWISPVARALRARARTSMKETHSTPHSPPSTLHRPLSTVHSPPSSLIHALPHSWSSERRFHRSETTISRSGSPLRARVMRAP
jgi:hypothetical protein